MKLSCPSLLGKTRPILGANRLQSNASGPAYLHWAPTDHSEVLLRVKEWTLCPTEYHMSYFLCSVLFCFFFLILDFSQFIDLTFVCDAAPWKANSMAFYTGLIVYALTVNSSTHSKDLNRIFQSTALMVHISGFKWIDDESQGLAVAESSRSLAKPNRPERNLCEHLICCVYTRGSCCIFLLVHDWLPL